MDSFSIVGISLIEIKICDIYGKLLLTKVEGLEKIDISFFKTGIFLAKILTEHTTITKKIRKQ